MPPVPVSRWRRHWEEHMNSNIYEGFVEHERYVPNRHRLAYPHHVYALDLDDLNELNRRSLLFGYNRPRPISLYDEDYLDENEEAIRKKLLTKLSSHLAPERVGRIVMVTSPRLLGHVFNPVSFYYCFSQSDRLLAVVAEVNNTFGEKHVYPLFSAESDNGQFPARFQAQKAFHVSPFNDMDGTYHFTFADIRRELDIRIDLHRKGEHVLQARLTGTGKPMTFYNHLKALLRHPIRPHLTIPRIYREAFKLRFARRLDFYSKPVPHSPMTIRRLAPTLFQRYCSRLVLDHLTRAKHGRLQLTMPDGTIHGFGGRDASDPVRMKVNDHRFFSRVVLGSDIGLGEGFMFDEWDTDDIADAVGFFIRNRRSLQEGDFKAGLLNRSIEYINFLHRANTLSGSRRNIGAHYDLSNDFFQTFLDDTMAYSCAIFDDPDEPLEVAQQRKFRVIMEKARLSEKDHLLEIGCGWGGFATEAVRQTGCRVTGITISKEQYEFARERVRRAGLEDRIEIRFCDYRQMRGRFDKIVSIEMLEAVGHRYYDVFFTQLDRLLAPSGIAVIQTITITDQRYEQYRRSHDWIQKHIFPGGLLPSLTVLTQAMTLSSSLMVDHVENIGNHYATTLSRWHGRFREKMDHVGRLGFDPTFQRKWSYYFGSCHAAFRERVLGNLQLVLTREGNESLKIPGKADG